MHFTQAHKQSNIRKKRDSHTLETPNFLGIKSVRPSNQATTQSHGHITTLQVEKRYPRHVPKIRLILSNISRFVHTRAAAVLLVWCTQMIPIQTVRLLLAIATLSRVSDGRKARMAAFFNYLITRAASTILSQFLQVL